jgi:hypothetical protein
MWITPVTPAAHRFGERFTWLKSQWKLRACPAQFWVEINSLYHDLGRRLPRLARSDSEVAAKIFGQIDGW